MIFGSTIALGSIQQILHENVLLRMVLIISEYHHQYSRERARVRGVRSVRVQLPQTMWLATVRVHNSKLIADMFRV